ncbi:MAG: hypothetical protein Q7U40_05880 [Desulfatirhabdiaceae bacterium]|nr:hypothetical protein [Desulfatirhabdiaceae bacterium]
MIKLPATLQTVQKIRKDIVESHGREHIDDIAHLCILGNSGNPKDLGKIVLLRALLQSILKSQDGGILKKHHGKAAHQDIVQAMTHFALLARVLDLPEALSHGGQ